MHVSHSRVNTHNQSWIKSVSLQTAIWKSSCLKQTLLCLGFINSLNSTVSFNYLCFKSIWWPHCSILFERSPKITMSSLCMVEKNIQIHPGSWNSLTYTFNGPRLLKKGWWHTHTEARFMIKYWRPSPLEEIIWIRLWLVTVLSVWCSLHEEALGDETQSKLLVCCDIFRMLEWN